MAPLAAEDEDAFQQFRWLAICFRIWKCNTQILKILRKEKEIAEANWEKAGAHWKAAAAKRAFFSWAEFGAAKERAVNEHLVGRVFSAWGVHILWKQEAEVDSGLHYNWTLVTSVFRIWGAKGRAAARRHAALVRHAELRKLRLFLAGWRHRARYWSALERCRQRVCERRAEIRKEHCFRGWALWCGGEVRERELVQLCLEGLAARTAARVLGVWALWAVRRRERHRLGGELEERVAGRRQQVALR
jgi:hypothetical protein